MENLMAARLQMAFTLGFHIVVACFGVGMPVLMLFAEWRFLRTADSGWRMLAKRWSKAFAVLFAVGAVSGTVLSFELGLLWPEFMAVFGSVIGLPFTLEGFAFFLEAIFAGIYLYGWERLGPRAHLWSGVPVAIAGLASAFLVVTANAWMNAPTGFELASRKVVSASPWRAMFNPAALPQATHMVIAAYIVSGFTIASVYAGSRLRKGESTYRRRAMALGLGLAASFSPLQILAGDWSAQVVAKTQPVKLAAMEGQFRTQPAAPLRLGGWPDERARATRYALEIPGALSLLAYGDRAAVVRGLDEFSPEDTPPVAVVHVAFQVMVAIGSALFFLSVWAGVRALRLRDLPPSRLFLLAVLASGPLAVVSLEAGWVVTEVGRQPWIVQGVMKTSEAVAQARGIPWLLAVTLGIYAILAAGTIAVLRLLAREGAQEAGSAS